MLQIIGWLGCVYLLVKSLEIFSSSNFRNEAGKLKETAILAALVAFWGAVGFAIWLGSPEDSPTELPGSAESEELDASIKQMCVKFAKTPEAAAECLRR